MYEPFEATAEFTQNGKLYTVTIESGLSPPENGERCMVVRGDSEWIYITREQAVKFFAIESAT